MVFIRGQRVRAVAFQNGWDRAGKTIGTGFEHTEGGGEGGETSVDRQLIVIVRIVTCGVRRKAACRTMFKSLINWQNKHLASTSQLSLHQNLRQVSFGPGIV